LKDARAQIDLNTKFLSAAVATTEDATGGSDPSQLMLRLLRKRNERLGPDLPLHPSSFSTHRTITARDAPSTWVAQALDTMLVLLPSVDDGLRGFAALARRCLSQPPRPAVLLGGSAELAAFAAVDALWRPCLRLVLRNLHACRFLPPPGLEEAKAGVLLPLASSLAHVRSLLSQLTSVDRLHVLVAGNRTAHSLAADIAWHVAAEVDAAASIARQLALFTAESERIQTYGDTTLQFGSRTPPRAGDDVSDNRRPTKSFPLPGSPLILPSPTLSLSSPLFSPLLSPLMSPVIKNATPDSHSLRVLAAEIAVLFRLTTDHTEQMLALLSQLVSLVDGVLCVANHHFPAWTTTQVRLDLRAALARVLEHYRAWHAFASQQLYLSTIGSICQSLGFRLACQLMQPPPASAVLPPECLRSLRALQAQCAVAASEGGAAATLAVRARAEIERLALGAGAGAGACQDKGCGYRFSDELGRVCRVLQTVIQQEIARCVESTCATIDNLSSSYKSANDYKSDLQPPAANTLDDKKIRAMALLASMLKEVQEVQKSLMHVHRFVFDNINTNSSCAECPPASVSSSPSPPPPIHSLLDCFLAISRYRYFSVHARFHPPPRRDAACPSPRLRLWSVQGERALHAVGRNAPLRLGTVRGFPEAPMTNGKSENQNNALVFARGQMLQVINL
jgi:hypothetical protein